MWSTVQHYCVVNLSFVPSTQKNILYEGEFFVFPSATFTKFPFLLYLCMESIHSMYLIVSSVNGMNELKHNAHHPSLIHSFSLPSICFFSTFTYSLIHSGNSLSFCFHFFCLCWLLLLFMYQTAFFDVTLIFL